MRPAGRLAIGINAAHYAAAGFGAMLERLVDTGRIVGLHLVDVPIYEAADVDDPDEVAHVALFEVS